MAVTEKRDTRFKAGNPSRPGPRAVKVVPPTADLAAVRKVANTLDGDGSRDKGIEKLYRKMAADDPKGFLALKAKLEAEHRERQPKKVEAAKLPVDHAEVKVEELITALLATFKASQG